LVSANCNVDTVLAAALAVRYAYSPPPPPALPPPPRTSAAMSGTGVDEKGVVLVTGGAGYIGSHTVLELLQADYNVVVVDNLINASREAVRRVEELAGKKVVKFYEVDLRDAAALKKIFDEHTVAAVVHFAGLKAVGESVEQPLRYFDNNVGGTITLLEAMATAGVHSIVFSSSATVYGDPASVPVTESFPLSVTNPYGRTKLHIEQILGDVSVSAPEKWRITILRYFNPVGANSSGRIGEHPKGRPNNLMPFVAQVAVGKRDKLSVFGNDYNTVDGTGVRDYIHVEDLAKGHIAALRNVRVGVNVYNLGTGRGYSVLEVVKAFSEASGKEISHVIAPRRAGDVAEVYADCSLAKAELGWSAELDMARMCADHWRWQSQNPNGYDDADGGGGGGGGAAAAK